MQYIKAPLDVAITFYLFFHFCANQTILPHNNFIFQPYNLKWL